MKPAVRNAVLTFVFILTLIALYFHDTKAIALAGTILFGLYGVLMLAFTIVYANRDWRANRYGRAIMYTNLSILSIIIFSFVNKAFGEWEYKNVVRVMLYSVLVVTEAQLFIVLLMAQKSRPIKEVKHE